MHTFPVRLTLADESVLTLTDVVATGDSVRIAVAGDVDMSSAPAFALAIDDVMRAYPGRYVRVDLAGVRFMDSSGIRVLLSCHKRAVAGLSVVGAQPGVTQVLQITGLYDLLTSDTPQV